MSKGPGRIERAIRELFDANPDLAFVSDELCKHCNRRRGRLSASTSDGLPKIANALDRMASGAEEGRKTNHETA
jgi:hypothetical protein